MSGVSGIFDSHAHYDDKRFADDQGAVLEKIVSAGVTHVCNIGADMPSSRASVALAETHDFFVATVGVHPHDAKSFTDADYEELFALSAHEKVVAIGEIGLDYHYDFSPRDVQKSVFEHQLVLAEDVGLPVVIHSREATEDTLSILQKKPEITGVVHSFSGSAETAKIYLKMGYYVGFTGVVTFKNARKILEAVEAVPLDRLLIETDAPYLAPVPFRGKRCDSSMLVATATKIAEIKGVSLETVVAMTAENAKRFYGITG